MSKKLDGKCISSKLGLIATPYLRDYISKRFQALLQILLTTLESSGLPFEVLEPTNLSMPMALFVASIHGSR
jgi:hypothetical protein